ncbi:MAG: single-stranded DNA-binding protein [Actinomycetota bacterium]
MPDNTITLVGNVTNDPELRFTPSGRQVANFSIAVNRRFRNSEGVWEDRLEGFFRCNVWGEMAENVAETLQKGTRVVLTGRLQQRTWEGPEGERREATEINIDEVGPSLRWATAQVTKSRRSGAPAAPAPQESGTPEWPAPQSESRVGASEEEGSF